MKIATFNIRCDYGQDGPNNFCFRQPLILRRLAAEKPDVIGFQEVLPHVQRWLREALPGYTVVGCGRGADYQGEAMTLAVRNETAELLDWRTFWLSPHPDVPGSRYQDQSECPRTCADAILYLRAEGRALRVYNTHLDHLSASARAKGLHRILERMQADRRRLALPAVLMGGFQRRARRAGAGGAAKGRLRAAGRRRRGPADLPRLRPWLRAAAEDRLPVHKPRAARPCLPRLDR